LRPSLRTRPESRGRRDPDLKPGVTDRELGLEAVPRTAPDEEEPGADNEDDD
jgi:hypothetical protein